MNQDDVPNSSMQGASPMASASSSAVPNHRPVEAIFSAPVKFAVVEPTSEEELGGSMMVKIIAHPSVYVHSRLQPSHPSTEITPRMSMAISRASRMQTLSMAVGAWLIVLLLLMSSFHINSKISPKINDWFRFFEDSVDLLLWASFLSAHRLKKRLKTCRLQTEVGNIPRLYVMSWGVTFVSAVGFLLAMLYYIVCALSS